MIPQAPMRAAPGSSAWWEWFQQLWEYLRLQAPPADATKWWRGDGTWVNPSSGTVTSETSFGQAAAAGSAATFSKGDHTHGTPANPVAASEVVAASALDATKYLSLTVNGVVYKVGLIV